MRRLRRIFGKTVSGFSAIVKSCRTIAEIASDLKPKRVKLYTMKNKSPIKIEALKIEMI